MAGDVAPPGDKSCSHRAVILGALAEGTSVVHGLLESADVLATVAAVRAFGAKVERQGPGHWHITGGEWHSPERSVDCGNSGTAARLLMGAAAGFPLRATFDGDESLRRRPMGRVTAPLTRMGARFDPSDRLPIALSGGSLRGTEHRNARASAQVKSAVLLAGLRADGPVHVFEPAPSRDHSEIMLRAFGCEVESRITGQGLEVALGAQRRLRATTVEISGDPSSAAFPLVAALITPGSAVTLRNVLLNPLRTGLFDALVEMGADLSISNRRQASGEMVGDVTARTSSLHGIEVLAERAPSMIDEYPILAVAAAFAAGPTVMRGLAELRHKESDRLRAIADGLRACGVEVEETEDSLTIIPSGRPRGVGEVETEGDHRIAMAFLVLGLAAREPVSVDRVDMIGTSFPGFAVLMRGLGARLEEI